MQSTLSFFVVVGLILWGFLMYQKSHPSLSFSINTPEKKAACAQIGYDVEGQQNLSYGDRIKQVLNGCW